MDSYRALGPMKSDEILCSIIFVLAMVAAFLRPAFANMLPMLSPAYIFLSLGTLMFFLVSKMDKQEMLSWKTAEKESMWGMMILFAGGLALGTLINTSGASHQLASLVSMMNLDGGITTIIVFTIFARLISEVTTSTTSAAVMVPIVLSFTTELGLNPIPYWFICVMAYNAEFILPISVRAIPVAYGLDANEMFKKGIPVTIISMISVVIIGWLCLEFWPLFGQLSYYTP